MILKVLFKHTDVDADNDCGTGWRKFLNKRMQLVHLSPHHGGAHGIWRLLQQDVEHGQL